MYFKDLFHIRAILTTIGSMESISVCSKLINSMSNGCKSAIKASGSSTKD
jgi:hypothetical protein